MKESDFYSYNNIAETSHIVGDYHTNSTTHIRGKVDGNITQKSDYKITQYRESIITGNINCFDLEIEGTTIVTKDPQQTTDTAQSLHHSPAWEPTNICFC